MILIFEGMDRSGKSSTIAKLNQFTDFKYPSIDRGPAGFMVYDNLLGRQTPQRNAQYIRDADSLFQGDVLCIYLYASEKAIAKRLEEEGATLPGGTTIKQTLAMYQSCIDELYPKHKVLKYNTTSNSTEWIVRDILNQIDKAHTFWPIDLHVDWEDHEEDKTYFHPSRNTIPETLFGFLNDFDATCDPAYYSMMYATLDHEMFKFKTGLINHRQIVVASHECIPCVQIIITDSRFTIDVKQRSLNLRKHGCNDLCFFYHWFKTSAFCRDYEDRELVVNYDIAFPHSFPF